MKIIEKLENRCMMKDFVGRMIQPVEERYQKCFNCSGYDLRMYCYVEPVKIDKKPKHYI